MTDDHRAFREWQIHLTMKINQRYSSKDILKVF